MQARQFLLDVATGQRPGDVAGLARLLQVQQRQEELEVLLDAALQTAQERPALIGLVCALWVAGLREEVDRLIDRAVSKLPGPAVVDLGDELRAVGREEAAFGLYGMAATSMAERPPDVLAQLCQAMTSAGPTDSSDKVATAAIATAAIATAAIDDAAADAGRFRDLVTAFWETEQDGYANQALDTAAVTLPLDGVVTLAAELRAGSREEAAFRLCARATTHRSSGEIHELVTALRDDGRPVDANKLLARAGARARVRTVVSLLDLCGEADRRRVLSAVVERSGQEIADLLRNLPDDDARFVMSHVVREGDVTLTAVLSALGPQQEGVEPVGWMRDHLHGDEAVASRVASLYATGQSDRAAVLLDAAAWVRATYADSPRFQVNSILRHLGAR